MAWKQSAAAAKAVKAARAAVGKGSNLVGWCEKFTRSCFGFSAKYASAKLAYEASKKAGGVVSSDGSDAPAGSVMFWDITKGKNAPYDHVAPVVATGVVASTSVGPGGTVGLVRITDLTRRWGMKPRGWAHIYHGQRILTEKKGSSPKPDPKPGKKSFPHIPLREDGHWGALTTKALQIVLPRKYSGGKNLVVDGKFGKVTIRATQRWLNALGYDAGPADGVWGRRSKRALQSFLYDKGLYRNGRYSKSVMVDGKFTTRSIRALQAYLNSQRQYL